MERICYESFGNRFHFAFKINEIAHFQNNQTQQKTHSNVSTLGASCIAQTWNLALHAPLSSSVSSHISSHCLLCVVSAFQKSAMKPYTCAIMIPESLGDEFTSVMWNSAHVWQGKSSVKELVTQVRCAFSCCSASTTSCFYSVVCFCWDD